MKIIEFRHLANIMQNGNFVTNAQSAVEITPLQDLGLTINDMWLILEGHVGRMIPVCYHTVCKCNGLKATTFFGLDEGGTVAEYLKLVNSLNLKKGK